MGETRPEVVTGDAVFIMPGVNGYASLLSAGDPITTSDTSADPSNIIHFNVRVCYDELSLKIIQEVRFFFFFFFITSSNKNGR